MKDYKENGKNEISLWIENVLMGERTYVIAIGSGKFRSRKITLYLWTYCKRGQFTSGNDISGHCAGAVYHADPEGAGFHESPSGNYEYRYSQLSASGISCNAGSGRRTASGSGRNRKDAGSAAGDSGAGEETGYPGFQSEKDRNCQPDEITGIGTDAVWYPAPTAGRDCGAGRGQSVSFP